MNSRLPLLFAALFALAHTQSPLYYSNQNQYFLSGLADGGVGSLSSDWLANTADPVPVFTAFVAFSVKHLGTWPFHAVFFVALMGYFLALWWLIAPTGANRSLWAMLIIGAHAGIVRLASDRLLGADYPWFFHSGLASQYVLGPGLQPSVIGVLLVAAVAAYRNERPILAAGLAAGANLIHATYLLPAAILIAGFLVGELLRKQWKSAGLSALLALLLVSPVVVYDLRTFAPTDSETFTESQRILSEIRIPHHTRPTRWFDWVAGLQVVWMALGLIALRRTRLFVPLSVTYTLVVIGTVAVIVTENPTLSLLFPWRVTAVLIPVSTAVVFGWVASRWVLRKSEAPHPPSSLRSDDDLSPAGRGAATQYKEITDGGATAPTSPRRGEVEHPAKQEVRVRGSFVDHPLAMFVVSLIFASSGIVVMAFHLGYREPEAENPVLQYVAATKQPGDLYLVPARIPKPSTARGVYSNTFVRPPDANRPGIFEIARFRLATGAPIFIDFKSIPYRDDEVLEWYRRVETAQRWFANPNWDTTGAIDEIQAAGITHVVAPTSAPLKCSRLDVLFEGGAYRVYRVK